MKVLMSNKIMPWIVCLAAALFFFYEFIQSNMFSSIAVNVMADFHIDAKSYSWLSSIYFLANVIFLFPAGAILDRFSTKKVILISLGICIFGTFLFAISSDYWVALSCRFLTGIGSAFCFLSCIRLASRWFPPSRMALATGVIVTFAMTGGMIAQTPLTLLIEAFDWRTAIIFDAVLGGVIFVIICLCVKDFPVGSEKKEKQNRVVLKELGVLGCMRKAYFRWRNILCGLYASLMNMPIVILGAMAGGIYLMQVNQMTRTDASYATSLLFIGSLIGAPVAGWISDYFKRKRIFMLLGAVISFCIMWILLYQHSLTLTLVFTLFFLLGFVTSTQILSYPMVAEHNPHELTATAVSVVSIMTQGGPFLYQNVFGQWLQEAWDGKVIENVPIYSVANYQHALSIILIGFVVAFIAAMFLVETRVSLKKAVNQSTYDSLNDRI